MVRLMTLLSPCPNPTQPNDPHHPLTVLRSRNTDDPTPVQCASPRNIAQNSAPMYAVSIVTPSDTPDGVVLFYTSPTNTRVRQPSTPLAPMPTAPASPLPPTWTPTKTCSSIIPGIYPSATHGGQGQEHVPTCGTAPTAISSPSKKSWPYQKASPSPG